MPTIAATTENRDAGSPPKTTLCATKSGAAPTASLGGLFFGNPYRDAHGPVLVCQRTGYSSGLYC
jgi:hypothetical protein